MLLFKVMNVVKAAEELARKAHQGQERKGGAPYITHPERVASLLDNAGFDELTIAAAWLHDTIEDTHVSEREIELVHPDLLPIIKAVSEDASLPWEERKRSHTNSVVSASDKAKAVACADRIDNLSSFLRTYKEIGPTLWKSWPERTPRQKLAADQYFLNTLKESWNNELVEKLEVLVNEEARIVND